MSTGKNAVIVFGGTTYACLTGVNVQGQNSVVETQCSTDGTGAAETKKSPGANNWTATSTLVLPDTGSTTQVALLPGTTDTLDVYMQGKTNGQPEYAWAAATVQDYNDGSGVTTQNTLAVTFGCDGEPTVGDHTP